MHHQVNFFLLFFLLVKVLTFNKVITKTEEKPAPSKSEEKPKVVAIPNTVEDKAAKRIQDAYKNRQAVKEAVENIVVTLYEAKDLIPADDNGN
jgi:DNA-binding TFAR19-related protein (PDSD5 family)